jgi:hypothetical protein
MILPGTYANGFAPRDGEPLFPELWRGCVGAWNPGLGPSGLTLQDWSPYKNHGTLTNMEAGADWVASQGRYALDFDGEDDLVRSSTGTSIPKGGESRTLAAWVFLKNSGSQPNAAIIQLEVSSGQTFILQVAGSNGSDNFAFTDGVNGINNLTWSGGFEPAGIWTFRAITMSNNQWVLVSRKFGQSLQVRATGTFSLSINTNTTAVRIGGRSGFATMNALISDAAIYNRAMPLSELALLSSRRGIAYEMAPRSWSAQQIAAYRARYYSQVIGSGVI